MCVLDRGGGRRAGTSKKGLCVCLVSYTAGTHAAQPAADRYLPITAGRELLGGRAMSEGALVQHFLPVSTGRNVGPAVPGPPSTKGARHPRPGCWCFDDG